MMKAGAAVFFTLLSCCHVTKLKQIDVFVADDWVCAEEAIGLRLAL